MSIPLLFPIISAIDITSDTPGYPVPTAEGFLRTHHSVMTKCTSFELDTPTPFRGLRSFEFTMKAGWKPDDVLAIVDLGFNTPFGITPSSMSRGSLALQVIFLISGLLHRSRLGSKRKLVPGEERRIEDHDNACPKPAAVAAVIYRDGSVDAQISNLGSLI